MVLGSCCQMGTCYWHHTSTVLHKDFRSTNAIPLSSNKRFRLVHRAILNKPNTLNTPLPNYPFHQHHLQGFSFIQVIVDLKLFNCPWTNVQVYRNPLLKPVPRESIKWWSVVRVERRRIHSTSIVHEGSHVSVMVKLSLSTFYFQGTLERIVWSWGTTAKKKSLEAPLTVVATMSP